MDTILKLLTFFFDAINKSQIVGLSKLKRYFQLAQFVEKILCDSAEPMFAFVFKLLSLTIYAEMYNRIELIVRRLVGQ